MAKNSLNLQMKTLRKAKEPKGIATSAQCTRGKWLNVAAEGCAAEGATAECEAAEGEAA